MEWLGPEARILKFVDTQDPDILATRRGGGVAVLFGLTFLASGGVIVAFAFGEGAPPLYVTLSFGAVFLLLGVLLAFGRAGTTLDRRQRTVVCWHGLLLPMLKTTRLLSYYDRVTIEREVRRGEHRTYTAYPVALSGMSGRAEAVFFGDPLDYPEARRTAERVSRFVSLPLVDLTTGEEVVREPDALDETLGERARRRGGTAAPAAAPSHARAIIREEEGALVVEIPPQALTVRHFKAMGVLAIAGAAAAVIALGVERLRDFESPDLVPFAPILLAIPLFASRAVLRKTRRSALVTATKEQLRVELRGPRSRRVVKIPTVELETLVVGDADRPRGGNGARGGGAAPGVGDPGRKLLADLFLAERGPSITASSDRARVSFGRGLSEEELRYLHALLEQRLSGA